MLVPVFSSSSSSFPSDTALPYRGGRVCLLPSSSCLSAYLSSTSNGHGSFHLLWAIITSTFTIVGTYSRVAESWGKGGGGRLPMDQVVDASTYSNQVLVSAMDLRCALIRDDKTKTYHYHSIEPVVNMCCTYQNFPLLVDIPLPPDQYQLTYLSLYCVSCLLPFPSRYFVI